jgi:sarcosine oxidase subunit alpha
MPPRRIVATTRAEPVAIVVDGERIEATPGEPVAIAIAAAGRLVLARSVKYHRPRGATCYAGRCDGCLMRVDGMPNVMTCRVPAREGMVVATQNVLGSAENDLLAAADWFFAGGMDHHRMFTWSKPVNRAMQKVARRIAGIGRLPDEVMAAVEPRDASCDVLVVGAGAAGLAAATELAGRGLSVVVAEEGDEPGGALRIFPGEVADDRGTRVHARELAARMANKATGRGAKLWLDHSVVGIYAEPMDVDGPTAKGDHALSGAVSARASWAAHLERVDTMPGVRVPLNAGAMSGQSSGGPGVGSAAHLQRADIVGVVAIDGPEGLVRLRARRMIVAAGEQEGSVAIEGGDRPGVIGVRAACVMLAHGVLPGSRVAVAGEGPWVDALVTVLRAGGAEVLGPFPLGSIHAARGRPAIEAVEVRTGAAPGSRRERHACDALVVAPVPAGLHEIAAQAGAKVRWGAGGFETEANAADGGTAAARVRAIGGCTGVREVGGAIAHGRAAAKAIATELGV